MKFGVMNGSTGCLPDNHEGPYDSVSEAIEGARDLFRDLEEVDSETPLRDELAETVNDLRTIGIHYFYGKAREVAGADYVEITDWEED